jgi:ABC-type multidrug transport system ATPase subunit
VLLLDEPYTGLDQDAAALLDELLGEVAISGRTVVMTTHDLRRGHALADRVAILNRGKITYTAPCSDIEAADLPALYADATGVASTR